jgi:hypothetical protein
MQLLYPVADISAFNCNFRFELDVEVTNGNSTERKHSKLLGFSVLPVVCYSKNKEHNISKALSPSDIR